jgi:DNA-binding transcriptional MerR regulator
MASNTPTYNLKAVIHETGINPATIRAWERRYGLFKPQRSPGGHRLYSSQDIELIKWLMARQEEGLSISHAAELWRSLKASGQEPLEQALAPSLVVGAGETILERLRREWIKACLEFDEPAAERAHQQAFAISPPETVCYEVFQKGLAEIGGGWYDGSISVQQEHFASALAMRRINTLFSATPPPTRTGCILAACPPGEQHEFALLLISFLLRRSGWDVVYLGANVPLLRLDSAIQHIAPRLILSSAQTLNSAATLREMAVFTSSQGIPLAYGGGVFNHIPELNERIAGHFLGNDLTSIARLVERLLSQPLPRPETRPVTAEYQELLDKFVTHESLIMASVSAEMLPTQIELAHLQEANSNLTSYINSALSLGDIGYLDHSVSWLNGMLENYGLPASLTSEYFAAYRQAVQQHLGSQAEIILDWFSKFK